LIERIGRLTIDESDCIANCANAASAIWHAFQQSRGPTATNWAGFYFVRPVKEAQGNGGGDKILVLGPFMGKPACKRIEFGSGVCGYVAKQLKTEVCLLLIRRELGSYILLFVFAFQSHWLCCFIDRK
jgi:L-methionine (R)-S-oxide reductase